MELLDVGPHFLTELLGISFPGATLNTLGFRNPSCYSEERVHRHFEHDLNATESELAVPEHDVVVMAEVIEHLHTAPELVLGFVTGFLKPGGFLVLQTPNAVAWSKRLAMLRGVNPFEPIRTSTRNPGHFREYTASELHELGARTGLALGRTDLADYFNVPMKAPVRALCRLRPELRQGITLVFRR